MSTENELRKLAKLKKISISDLDFRNYDGVSSYTPDWTLRDDKFCVTENECWVDDKNAGLMQKGYKGWK